MTTAYSLHSARLMLRPFTPDDLPDFAALRADPLSMADYGMTFARHQSAINLHRQIDDARHFGIGRLHVSDRQGFIGYVGVVGHRANHPLGAHFEIGWRLLPRAWRKGYAVEAARIALPDAFARTTTQKILSYTAPDNARSCKVMARLGLDRRYQRDFTIHDPDIGAWHGQVWSAARKGWTLPRSSS